MGIKMHCMDFRVTFREEVLGSLPNNPEIMSEFIASKAPDAEAREEEIARVGVEGVMEKGMTVFARTMEGREPCLLDYHWKGYFKDSCSALSRIGGAGRDKDKSVSESAKLTAFKKVIDKNIFVAPREIRLELPKNAWIETCERPLRAATAQGERVALQASESAPEGTTCEFTVKLLNPKLRAVVMEWMGYGRMAGFGQWRNSGKGRFSTQLLREYEESMDGVEILTKE